MGRPSSRRPTDFARRPDRRASTRHIPLAYWSPQTLSDRFPPLVLIVFSRTLPLIHRVVAARVAHSAADLIDVIALVGKRASELFLVAKCPAGEGHRLARRGRSRVADLRLVHLDAHVGYVHAILLGDPFDLFHGHGQLRAGSRHASIEAGR